MAVITKYFIVRNGVELDKVFEDKKEADAYDQMLDAAEKLADFIRQGNLEIDLDEKTVDEISVYLAKNGPEVTKILKGVKPLKKTAPEKPKKPAETEPADEKKMSGKKPGPKSKDK